MKKDGIQTRNRRLNAGRKRQRTASEIGSGSYIFLVGPTKIDFVEVGESSNLSQGR